MSAHLYALLGWIRETSLGRNFKWNTSSSTVVLPQEIKDEILGYLWDDKRALGACALACRAFLDPSQKLIFSKVIVSPPTPKRRARSSTTQRPGLTATRLARLLESIPRLCRYVQHLEIRDEEDEWLLKDTSIPQILPRFINLRALVINYRKFRYSDIVSWPDNFL
ncbi:hypothetical protein CPB84DRAFT_297971 [Gymnopilus junonius]|uniref:F-box domain-containing protein n=1 Tax=Gymnopilus junonius TaxID=109634 RepID=A0A9P5NUZ7_GYMJU|nr:hypothetical protein CPB84DRAFT_297971 [Gymnopilus junonius]